MAKVKLRRAKYSTEEEQMFHRYAEKELDLALSEAGGSESGSIERDDHLRRLGSLVALRDKLVSNIQVAHADSPRKGKGEKATRTTKKDNAKKDQQNETEKSRSDSNESEGSNGGYNESEQSSNTEA